MTTSISVDELQMLSLNEMTMCRNREDRHWGAAWAYYDVARRMYGEDADYIASKIHQAAKNRGF